MARSSDRLLQVWLIFVILFSFVDSKSLRSVSSGYSKDDYMTNRQEFLAKEQQERLGGGIVLTSDETKANDILMRLKASEVDASLVNGEVFPPQISFLHGKPLIQKSKVFQLIQMMPKGGALHVHDVSITDIWWLVKNVTYRDNCYMCYDNSNKINFHFYRTLPSQPSCAWKPVRDYRQQSGNSTAFDEMLYKSMILTDDTINQDINTVWKRFLEILDRASGLIKYAPVFRDYYYQALTEMNADNVQYVEVRALLFDVYDFDSAAYSAEQMMSIYHNTTGQFINDNSGFSGASIIRTNLRFRQPDSIMTDIVDSISLRKKFPDTFAGYDLVGQEDPGKPLLYYLDPLLYPSQQNPPADLPYFFHAGETDWQGTKVDDNLIDAILLNTTRVGHGYALTKHPEVLKAVKSKGIGIEVNPISNQVLRLVDDLRNHPAATLIDQGYPVIISSDDPSVWGATGLSYDFYMAFMALSGKNDGIRTLKQLAMNSLLYSAMKSQAKTAALRLWEQKWDDFISKVINIGQGGGAQLIG